jgi:mRNA interferase MazF
LALAQAGADVLLNYNSDLAGAQQVAAAIEKAGRKAVLFKADVGYEAEVIAMFRFMTEQLGRIVLVAFPFDDLTTTKVRPAVCLTGSLGPHRHVVLAFVSNRVPSDLFESDIKLASSSPNFAKSGLKVSSVLRLHRLMTVSESFIRRELGELAPEWQQQVATRLRKLFGL